MKGDQRLVKHCRRQYARTEQCLAGKQPIRAHDAWHQRVNSPEAGKCTTEVLPWAIKKGGARLHHTLRCFEAPQDRGRWGGVQHSSQFSEGGEGAQRLRHGAIQLVEARVSGGRHREAEEDRETKSGLQEPWSLQGTAWHLVLRALDFKFSEAPVGRACVECWHIASMY